MGLEVRTLQRVDPKVRVLEGEGRGSFRVNIDCDGRGHRSKRRSRLRTVVCMYRASPLTPSRQCSVKYEV